MLGLAVKIAYGLLGCAAAGLGAWLYIDPTFALPITMDRQVVSVVCLSLGAIFILGAVWARIRSMVGLVVVATGTAAAIWAVHYGNFNVWQLIPMWIAAFVGVFATLVYLIAFVRGKDLT